MFRLLVITCSALFFISCKTEPVTVKNIDELNQADKNAKPGDVIILQDGKWENVAIKLSSKGTKEKPITFKAATPGKVNITGHSSLKIGGEYIVVDGLLFSEGYAGDDALITYRVNKDSLANNCRVTNCVVDDFNNPKRLDENYWVAFYGKNNQLDHCSFKDKNNIGVLLAVILDDDRSRQNFHSIDHNYFGRRAPLGSNGGEIIRVGVSQHCQFSSNTEIKNNFFENCDGETEIISIKSCDNVVAENIFKECQGSVVFRHGDRNLVSDNYFLGNNKPGTGGVRVINKGQKVINNLFYECRGVDFRSPLAVMNGIPNSPANRYVQVIDAEISENIFYQCSPITLCEGSDTERTLPPKNVKFTNNIFYNDNDKVLFKKYDDISGFMFDMNEASDSYEQELPQGFTKSYITIQSLNTDKGASINMMPTAEKDLYDNSGASWFNKEISSSKSDLKIIDCPTTEAVHNALAMSQPVTIRLTGNDYSLSKPFEIKNLVHFIGNREQVISLSTGKMMSAFIIAGKGNLVLENLSFDGKGINAENFISNDTSGSSDHYNLSIVNCTFENINRESGCSKFFNAYKSMIADSIVFHGNLFANNSCDIFDLSNEKDDKGYYNAEKIFIGHNSFRDHSGMLLNIYRGGNDESTLGPNLTFSHNVIENSSTKDKSPLILLTGVQVTNIFANHFTKSNRGKELIKYIDFVRAKHDLERNSIKTSGKIVTNKFVVESGNTIQ